MRFILLFVAFIGYSSMSTSATITSTIGDLNGEFSFTEGNQLSTEIKSQFGQIDNFLRSHENQQETNFIELSPKLFVQTQSGGSLFQLQATASYLTFDEFSNDDHYDFSVLSKFHLRFAESQKLFLSGFIADKYEYRGTGLSLGKPNTLDEGDTKRNEFLNVGYLYGHQDSLARAKVLMGYRDFEYQSRESITKPLAYSSNYFQGNFDYLITGNTYFTTKIQFEDLSYEMNDDLERKQYLALAGMKWRSTELTQVHLLLGYEKTTFNNSKLEEKDRFAWQVKLSWNPLQRFNLVFSSGSEVKNSTKIIKTVNYSNYYDLGLNYKFNEKFEVKINGKLVNDELSSIEDVINEDHFEISTEMNYQWRHWLSGFIKHSYNSFESDEITFDFDLRDISAGITVTF